MFSKRTVNFTDSTGRDWHVSEHPGLPHSIPPCGPSLLFVNHEMVRRVRVYPASWYDLPPAELATLSWRT